MEGRAYLRGIFLTILLCALALAFATCGGSSHRVAPPIQTAAVDSLDDTLAELDALAVPDGIDPVLFEELKDALASQLESRFSNRDSLSDHSRLESRDSRFEGKLVCAPPTGEANRVDDLAILDNGDGTFALSWHYKNLGDYDQDGVVGLPDIYPLAEHYNESYEPEDINCIQAVIDGSGNGRIGIEDITPIAMNFAVDVHHYAVEGAAEEAGAYELVSEVAQDTGSGDGRLEYSAVIQSPAALWHRVVPCDSEGTPGEPSNAVLRPSNEPIV